jgi:PIN domain nuclease of toxin-antitoxin system
VSDTYVLDSFAVLALLRQERGSADVAEILRQAGTGQIRVLMSWVNAGEVAYIVERRWGAARMHAMLANLEGTSISIVPAGRELTVAAARLKARFAVSYADCFCAALALHSGGVVLTGDPEFKLLEEDVKVQWIGQNG